MLFTYSSVKRGGGGENLVYGSLSSSFLAFFMCFTVMSKYSLDDPGFPPPVPPVTHSSKSLVETPVDGRRILFRVLWLA